MKSIAIFRSNSFDLSWPQGVSDPNDIVLGQDLAEHVRHKLAESGAIVSAPTEDESFWLLDVTLDNTPFSCIVHWAPLGEPPEDWWVVQPYRRQGVLKALLGKRPDPTELRPICELLSRLLGQDPKIHDLQWLTEDEFKSLG